MQLDTANAKSQAEVDYISKQLYDFNNIQIYSKIYIGSEKREFDMIFDTGSAWVWVENKSCRDCANPNKFNNTESTTFKQTSMMTTRLYYGMGMVEGLDSTDQVCLNKDSTLGHGCMPDYLFKSVVH